MTSAAEQMTSAQLPLGAIAPQAPAAQTFRRLWNGIDGKLCQMRLARKVVPGGVMPRFDPQGAAAGPLAGGPPQL